MSPHLKALKRKPDISLGEFKTTLFGVFFATSVAIVGLAVGLKPAALATLAAYHQQACSDNPVLLGWTQHVLPVMPAFVGLLLLLPSASASLTLIRQYRQTSKLYRLVKHHAIPLPRRLVRAATSLEIADRVTCVQDASVYAFCFGLLSPRICISTGMVGRLTREELEAVILHESSHLHHHDPLRLLISRVVANALVMLPVAEALRERYQLAMELAADKRALSRMPVEVLASALLKVFATSAGSPQYQFAAMGALDVTRERIANLTGMPKRERIPPVPRYSLLVSAFVAFAVFIGTAGFSEASGYWGSQAHTCTVATSHGMTAGTPLGESKTLTPRCSHGDERLEMPVTR